MRPGGIKAQPCPYSFKVGPAWFIVIGLPVSKSRTRNSECLSEFRLSEPRVLSLRVDQFTNALGSGWHRCSNTAFTPHPPAWFDHKCRHTISQQLQRLVLMPIGK